ncbi:S8 family serine peptidase [Variovorax boronicumulans]
MKPVIAVLLLVTGLLPVGAGAQPSAPTELQWESTESAHVGIQTQVERLHGALYELKQGGARLQTRKVLLADESGASVLALARKEQLYVGTGENFPRSLELLLCELNADKCAVREDRAGVPRARWAKLTNAEIEIPDLRLQPVPQIQTYDKKKGDRISTIVLKERMGCQVFDAQCEAHVRRLNPNSIKLEPNYAGTILVPATGYTTRIPLATSTSQDIAQGAIASKYGVRRESAERFISNVIATPAPTVRPNSGGSAGGQTSLAEVLRIIRYKPLERSRDRLLSIGLVDSAPDLQHCALDLRTIAERNNVIEFDGTTRRLWPWSARKPEAPCGRMSSLEVSEEEHGTHLLGLWFAGKASPAGEGMLPRDDRTALGLGPFKYGKATQPAQYMQIGKVLEVMGLEISVINLSWGLPASVALANTDPLKPRTENIGAAIARYAHADDSPVLFVASAGNEKRKLDIGACDITPACGPTGRRNVLTVTALTNDEKDPDVAANFGRPVDIGVPALNLVSTLRNDLVGRASGSSQAAAIASAAAAMLMYGTGLSPEQARNRLIYTSDLTPRLQAGNGKIFGGRLNFERAAMIQSPRINLDGVEKPANVIFGRGDPVVRIISADDTSRMEEIRASWIKRITRKAGQDADRTHTIFYTHPERRTLFRIDGTLDADSERIAITTTFDSASRRVGRLADVRDYTARGPRRLD